MSVHLQRALLLMEQSREELAEQELRKHLESDPEDARAHALLALCLSRRENYTTATEEAQAAIARAPDLAFGYYALASVMHDRNRLKEALAAIKEAIRLEPDEADYFAMLAAVQFSQRQWNLVLEASEQGLALDPDHVQCTNLHAMALVKLGRKEEAGRTIDAALRRDPEDALSHANQGWTLLEKGDHRQALEHFREALRLEPGMDWARQGIVEALKARYFIYGMVLRYFLWMAKLSPRAQWGVVVGGYVGYQLLRSMARTNPQWEPYIWPLLIVYLGFALLTWIGDPLFNLLLRLNRFGRLALSREEIVFSNWIGGCILLSLAGFGLELATGHPAAFLTGVVGFAILIPLSSIHRCSEGWPRRAMILYTLALALVGFGNVALSFSKGQGSSFLLTLFLVGAILSGWVANILVSIIPRR
jgi:tetratricopeptide (TPR) repeat protein